MQVSMPTMIKLKALMTRMCQENDKEGKYDT